VYPVPNFEGSRPFAVQQGAGMAVSKSNSQKEEAAVTFLKWFTDYNQNGIFCGASGYLPVKKQASGGIAPENTGIAGTSPVVSSVLMTGQAMTQTYTLYSGKPFPSSSAFRAILETSLQEKVGTKAEVLIEPGDPPKVVCGIAERLHASLLVIGRGSAGGVFGRLRTNAYAIIRQSPCPVASV
jgi:multiple sugar transport system substrate-binding protein